MNPGPLLILILLVFFVRLTWAIVGIAVGVVIFRKEIAKFLKELYDGISKKLLGDFYCKEVGE